MKKPLKKPEVKTDLFGFYSHKQMSDYLFAPYEYGYWKQPKWWVMHFINWLLWCIIIEGIRSIF